ncbi:MAG: ComEC/Rec2 family competence protein [Eggerthellaceae bacterium]
MKKHGCLWAFIIFIVICIAASSCSGGGSQDASQDSSTTQEQTQASDNAQGKVSASAKNSAKSSKAKQVSAKKKSSGTLTVRFVDVGQGDGTIVEFPDGKTLVIDTAADGQYAMDSQLADDHRGTINWLVATHPDSDHIGGLADIIANHKVESVWAPAANSSTQTFTNFLEAVDAAGLSIHTAVSGKTIATGKSYSIKLLWPPKGASYSDTNDYSAIVLVTFESKKFLFTGDAPVEAQEEANCGHVDVLKVSHHGSASGTDHFLASELSPSVAVLSYGLDNSYGHPTQVVLNALRSAGAKVYGTGAQGTVTVTSNGNTIHVKTQHKGKVVAASQTAGAGSKNLDSGSSEKKSNASHKKTSNGGGGKDTVYVTPTGEKYHKAGCRTLSRSKNIIKMSKAEAKAQGYTACAVCGG